MKKTKPLLKVASFMTSLRSPRQSPRASPGPQRDPGRGTGGLEPIQKPLQVPNLVISNCKYFLFPSKTESLVEGDK